MVTLFMGREYTAEINVGAVAEVTVSSLAHLVGRDALIGQVAKKFLRMCRDAAPASAYYVESIGTMLGTHLLQALVHEAGRPRRDGKLSAEALLRVTRYIDERIGDSLSLGKFFKRLRSLCDITTAIGQRWGRRTVPCIMQLIGQQQGGKQQQSALVHAARRSTRLACHVVDHRA